MGLCCSDQVHGEDEGEEEGHYRHRRRGWADSSAGSTRSLSGNTMATASINSASLMSMGGSLRSVFGASHVAVAPISEASYEDEAHSTSHSMRSQPHVDTHSGNEDQNNIELQQQQQLQNSTPGAPYAIDTAPSPMREKSMRSCVPSTPQGPLAQVYKYYCPLCMAHYEDVFTARCCGNYCCLNCVISYLNSKNIKVSTVDAIIRNPDIIEYVPCPNCGAGGFHPVPVSFDDAVRNYATTPGAAAAVAANSSSSNNSNNSQYIMHSNSYGHANGTHHGLPLHSPVKIGDSFDDLKRKMRPFFSENDSGIAEEASSPAMSRSGSANMNSSGISNQQHLPPHGPSDAPLTPISEGAGSATPSTRAPLGASPFAISTGGLEHDVIQEGSPDSRIHDEGEEGVAAIAAGESDTIVPRAIDRELAGVEDHGVVDTL